MQRKRCVPSMPHVALHQQRGQLAIPVDKAARKKPLPAQRRRIDRIPWTSNSSHRTVRTGELPSEYGQGPIISHLNLLSDFPAVALGQGAAAGGLKR
jgi:hypothetical protein